MTPSRGAPYKHARLASLAYAMPLTLEHLRTFLDAFLHAEPFEDDQNGIYRPSLHTIKKLGLALEPRPDTADWIKTQDLDALFLHRPWKLGRIPEGVGVLAYHYAFDERLTTGYNPLLADALGFTHISVLGFKGGRPLGMIGDVPAVSLGDFRTQVEAEFGGLEGVYGAETGRVSRACVVGAMRPALVYEAAERGAQVYLTGQYRKGAARAVVETGMSVFEIGHQRSEVWGLKTLATTLREQFPGLEAVVSPPEVKSKTDKAALGA